MAGVATAAIAPSPTRAAEAGTPRWSPVELLGPLVVLALGVVLLLPGHALWFDELFTAEVARLPLGEIVSAIVHGTGTTAYLDGVPPSYNAPYYLVVHLWTSLPGLGGDTSLRVLSLLATAGGLALITRAVARLAGRATGVAAGMVLACSPLVLEQAVEARSYGLAVLATGGAALGLVRWLQQPPRGLVLFGLAGAGMGLAHWYAVTVARRLRRRGAGAARPAGAARRGGRRRSPPCRRSASSAWPCSTAPARATPSTCTTPAGGWRGLAVEAWSAGNTYLLVVLVGLAVLGAVRARGVRVVGVAWLLVPLVLLTVAELRAPGLPPALPAGRAARAGRARRRRRVHPSPPRPGAGRRPCSSG